MRNLFRELTRFTAARFLIVAAVPCLLHAGRALADSPSGFKTPLFNGQNLDGWQVSGCKTSVENGLLVLKAGDGFVRSDFRYADFVLEVEWRARTKQGYDSGIYFRAELPPDGRPWPTRHQANLAQGKEGNVNTLAHAESQGLIKAGEWNRFRLTVIGTHAEMEINDQPAWKADGVEPADGYIGLQAEVPLGGQFEFKSIEITELDYQSLFNGVDLSGWEGGGADAASCWKALDGELVCTGEPGPWLRSGVEYGDFDLRFEYKLLEGGNSGVYVRVPADGAHRGKDVDGDRPTGVEVQVLDDQAERYKDIMPYQYCGSLYAIAAAEQHVGRAAGVWNCMEITCRGTKYRVVHNGVTIVDTDADQYPELAQRQIRGFLGLQNHSEAVSFRRLRVLDLTERP